MIGEYRPYCSLLVVPNVDALFQLIGTTELESAELFQRRDVLLLYQEIIDETNRSLGSWEQIKRFSILPRELTQEQGELTPTLKIKRRVVDSHFKEIIDAMYDEKNLRFQLLFDD